MDAEPREVWRASVGRGVAGLPAVSSRVTLVTSTDRWVYAIDTRSGETFWRKRGDGVFSTGPVVDGGRVFVASEGTGGRVTAMRLSDGGRIWQTTVGDVSSPLALHDSVLYGVNDDGDAFALDAAGGDLLWRRSVGPTRSGPLVIGQYLAIVTLRDSLFVLERARGVVRSASRMSAATTAPLARLDDTTVVAASPAGSIEAVRIPNGRTVWTARTNESMAGAPVVVGDTVFALGRSCTLFRVLRHLGDVSRRDVIPDCITTASPLVMRDGVLVATVGGEMTYIFRATGRRMWTRKVGGPLRHPPVVLDRQAVIATLGGEVFGFR